VDCRKTGRSQLFPAGFYHKLNEPGHFGSTWLEDKKAADSSRLFPYGKEGRAWQPENLMKSVKQLISTAVMNEAYQYMAKDPMKNLPKMIDWAERIMTQKDFYKTAEMFRDIAKNPTNNWNQLIQRYFAVLQ